MLLVKKNNFKIQSVFYSSFEMGQIYAKMIVFWSWTYKTYTAFRVRFPFLQPLYS